MPVTVLSMQAVAGRSGWMQPLNNAQWIANINSDDPTSGGSRTGVAPLNIRWSWTIATATNLPVSASAAFIQSFNIRHSARRSGGAHSGQHRILIFSAAHGAWAFGPVRQSGAPAYPIGLRFWLDNFTLNVPGPEVRWSYERINEVRFGWQFGPGVGSGMSVYYIGPQVTWVDESGGLLGEFIGASWLPPLIAAGLGGLNLAYEDAGRMCHFLSELYGKVKVRNFPAFDVKHEREEMAWELFRRPRFCFLGER